MGRTGSASSHQPRRATCTLNATDPAKQQWDAVGHLDRQIARTGGLRQLRPQTRRTHQQLLDARHHAQERLHAAQEQLRTDRAVAAQAASAADEHDRWARANQWRHADLDRIDARLADHWAATVLSAVREDDPLAYGLDRLRGARTVLATRDGTSAEGDLEAVDHALARERVARIMGIAAGEAPAPHLTSRLGQIPDRGLARDTWCGLAYQIEGRLDSGVAVSAIEDRHGTTIVDRLARHRSFDPLDQTRALIDAARRVADPHGRGMADGPDGWLQAVDFAAEAHRVLERQRSRELDRDLGISL